MVVGAEASVAVVAVGHKVEAEPVFVADDRRWDIAARQPGRETERLLQVVQRSSLPGSLFFPALKTVTGFNDGSAQNSASAFKVGHLGLVPP